MELEIEAAAIELLALQQPMARDLRFIISAIKVSSDLERVGDHAVNIAQSGAAARRARARRSRPIRRSRTWRGAPRRCWATRIDAFVRADGALGREVCSRRRRSGRDARVGVPHPR